MYAEIWLNKDGTIKHSYVRKYPPPYGWEDTEEHKIVKVDDSNDVPKWKKPTADLKGWEIDRPKYLARVVRPLRNKRLAETDWTQMPDAPITAEEKTEWAAYRQQLRDLPDTLDVSKVSDEKSPLPEDPDTLEQEAAAK